MAKKMQILLIFTSPIFLASCGNLSIDYHLTEQGKWETYNFPKAEISLPDSFNMISLSHRGLNQVEEYRDGIGKDFADALSSTIEYVNLPDYEMDSSIVQPLLIAIKVDKNIPANTVSILYIERIVPPMPMVITAWPLSMEELDVSTHDEIELGDTSAVKVSFRLEDSERTVIWEEQLWIIQELGYPVSSKYVSPQYWIRIMTNANTIDQGEINSIIATFKMWQSD
jgi:hypothetical protein